MSENMNTASIVKLCQYCGGLPHAGVCPSVKAFEYHPNGQIKRVEFHGPAPINWPPPYYPMPQGPFGPFPIT